MIQIDGSFGEGGGQILRVAVALSAITQKPVKITNLRANRSNPGLAAQHLCGIKAAAEMCNAKLKGAEIRSTSIEFYPQKIRGGKYKFDVGTAGAITLVLQTLIPIANSAERESTIEITGGTDVIMAPTVGFFKEVFNYYFTKMGGHIIIEDITHGFYPKGKGYARIRIIPKTLKPLYLTKRGELMHINVESTTSKSLSSAKVAEREVNSFTATLKDHAVTKESKYVSSLCPGTSMLATAEFTNCKLGCSVIGERGVSSEEVGNKCAEEFKRELDSDATVDHKMADQILLFLALTGGEFKTSQISRHVETSIWVIEKFFGRVFTVDGLKIKAEK